MPSDYHICRDGRGERCEFGAIAVVRMLAPDGVRVPGGTMCQAHADAVIAEYREKLGEQWSTQPTGWTED